MPKDNVKTLMWFNLALPGLRGEEAANAQTFRDEFSSGMTRQQVAQAEELTTRCRDLSFMACDEHAPSCTAQRHPRGNGKVMDGANAYRSQSDQVDHANKKP